MLYNKKTKIQDCPTVLFKGVIHLIQFNSATFSRVRRILAGLLAAATLLPFAVSCSSEFPAESTTSSTTGVGSSSQPTVNDNAPRAGELVITEVMTSNTSSVVNTFGEYSDWFELYNASQRSISLKGCFITDNADKPYLYECPDITLGAGEYLLFFASDRGTVVNGKEYHTNFKLSAGETVTINYMGETLSSLKAPEDLAENISFGYLSDGESNMTVYLASPTPGYANGGSYSDVLAELNVSSLGVRINEFMMKNSGVFYDEDGDCPDWVELINTSTEEIRLAGFGLSDDFADPLKWTLPDITLQPGETLLVLLSGKEKTYTEDSAFLHADFKLSDSDDGLLLSNATGVTIDRIATVALPETASYGRDPSDPTAWKFFTYPTPGKANSANGTDTLEAFALAAVQKLYINEVCSVSSSSSWGGTPKEDWIELYNNTDQPINLAGWSLSKSVGNLRHYTFPDVTIAAKGYLTVSASGVASTTKGSLDTGFKVNRNGNTVYLVSADGYVTDAFDTGFQRAGISSGRAIENGKFVRLFYTSPTKNKVNNAEKGFSSYALPATIESSSGKLVANAHVITMTTAEKNGKIYYTLDGTKPGANSRLYEGPFPLTSSASVRAVVMVDGKIRSEYTNQTFLVTDEHDLNVVCLTCDPADLFSEEKGIWANGEGWTPDYPHKGANFWMDWEREVFFEYYEKDGSLGIAFSAGIKNHGQYSRAMEQKSVSINLKEVFGSGTSYYPFMENSPVAFDNLLLRTGSQDAAYTNIVDAYCARVVSGEMDLDLMNDRPVAVYINGEYWGMYYIRDKINESYIYHRTGIEEDNLDAIKANKNAETGSATAHNALINYVKTHDLSVQEYYDYVASQIDVEEWTNYWITQSFFANTDTGNIRFYCSKDGTGKWRWILFDLDWALFRSTYHWNMIEEFINPAGHGSGNAFSTAIAVAMFKNADYKKYFIEQYAHYMHTVFDPDRMIAILDDMVAEVDSEMARHCKRWSLLSYSSWQKNIDKLRTIVRARWDYSKGDLQETFNLSNEYMAELFPEDKAE